MIDGLKPYPSYRSSLHSRLDSIPSTWNEIRAKYVFREVDNRSATGGEELLSVSHLTGVRRRKDINASMLLAESNVGHKVCDPGDLVINTMWAWMGALAVSPYRGLVSPAYGVYRPLRNTQATPSYLHHLLRTPQYVADYVARSTGLHSSRLRLYPDIFLRTPVAIPPPAEQAAIVRYLKHVTHQIDLAIAAQTKSIASLNAQRMAILHSLITENSGPCKNTGSAWFSTVPADWSVIRLGRVINAAIDGPHFSPKYHDTGIPFLSARNIKFDRWSLSDVKFISESDYKVFSRRVRPELGDVLYTKGGTTGVARVVDLDYPFQVWVHVAVLKIKRDRILPNFLALCLNSPKCYEQSQLFTRGATNQDLGLGRMKGIELPLPPSLETQAAVCARVATKLNPLDGASAAHRKTIQILHEYRTRLIADIVTGKLDVRAAAASLPADADEPVPVALDADGDDQDTDEDAGE